MKKPVSQADILDTLKDIRLGVHNLQSQVDTLEGKSMAWRLFFEFLLISRAIDKDELLASIDEAVQWFDDKIAPDGFMWPTLHLDAMQQELSSIRGHVVSDPDMPDSAPGT